MSQNINLFGPAFRKQRQLVTMNLLAVCLAITLLALAAILTVLEMDVRGLTEELRAAEALLKAQQGYVAKLQADATVRKAGAQLDAETTRLENELKLARESMDALKSGVIGTQEGFAEYLRAFSRQSVNGLWLTGLTIGRGGEVEIHGRVVSPDLVPSYIQRLNREKVLAGRSFARLEMVQPKPEPEKGKDKDKDKDKDKETKKARIPRYLEFSLATADGTKTEKAQ
jgi:hypothetical protein